MRYAPWPLEFMLQDLAILPAAHPFAPFNDGQLI